MESAEKINVRGAINALTTGETVALHRRLHTVSGVRSTASSIACDTGKRFTVDGTDKKVIKVTRIK